ncbi:DUF6011 domain-containing protein [Streptomyces sp. NPDC006193]|uniref:DUF6011 domain-containing protein n=1 Tax=Streptomyces sp. NPDC006193 TaxID=3155717 RepID=UPI0033A7B829
MKCRYCPRTLHTPESQARGYGPICGRKHGLIQPPAPRQRATTAPVTPVTTPDVHPNQTAIPIQTVIPMEL